MNDEYESVKEAFANTNAKLKLLSNEKIYSETIDFLNGTTEMMQSDDYEKVITATTQAMIDWIVHGDNVEKLVNAYVKVQKAVVDVGIKNALQLFSAKRKIKKAYDIIEESSNNIAEQLDDIAKIISESDIEKLQLKNDIEALKKQVQDLIDAKKKE